MRKKRTIERVSLTRDNFEKFRSYINELDEKDYAVSTIRNYMNFRSSGERAERMREIAISQFSGRIERQTIEIL